MPRNTVFATLTKLPSEFDPEPLDLALRHGGAVTVRDLEIWSGLERLIENQVEASRRGLLPRARHGDLWDSRGRTLARQFTTTESAIHREFNRRVKKGFTITRILMVTLHRRQNGQYALNHESFSVTNNDYRSAWHAELESLLEYDWSAYSILVVDFDQSARPTPPPRPVLEIRITAYWVVVKAAGREVVRHPRRKRRTISPNGRWRAVTVSYEYRNIRFRRIYLFLDGILVRNVSNREGVY